MEREVPAEPVSEGTVLWQSSEEQKAQANITRYLRWLREKKGLDFGSYDDLWAWSVTDLEGFWASIWDFFGVKAHRSYRRVLAQRRMPRARWFAGAELNYAEHALQRRDDHLAVVFKSEVGPLSTLTYAELYRQVAAVAAGLRRLGVQRGDRVVAYMPNIPQALVAFLAATSIGAVWSSCSPDFGIRAVVDRFQLIEPKVLFAVDGYHYNGKPYERLSAVAEIQRHLSTLETTVVVPYLDEQPVTGGLGNVKLWGDLFGETGELSFEAVPFEHPLWVLYSSGTTGVPKAIVQGHGGILLEHLKALSLHLDLTSEDRFFWFTTTGWMMWNFLISGLLLGTTILLYDGSPGHPDIRALWRFAEETGMTYFGTSAPYILSCMRAGIEPGREFNLSSLRAVGSTGAPLPPEGFQWIYDKVEDDLLLGSVSGGTDMCTAFVLSCPTLPVRAGELQCRGLGARVEAYDERGHSVVEEVGELVITEPLPSMPLFFWNDPDDRRYQESYFDMFPGVWRHGDWIKIGRGGSCVIYGRSDSTLNRAGVRMGSSEFYRVVEDIPEIVDSLVVDTGQLGSEGRLLLFVVPRSGVSLDEELQARIGAKLRQELSPRYVPDEMYAVSDIPRTLNDKKLEVPIKRILTGTPPEKAVSPDAISNPRSMNFFIDLARSLQEASS